MPEIQPIDDSYIDGVIKVADAYNPNLSKTQGVRLRELIKLMRDRFEQRLATVPSGLTSAKSVQSYAAMLANGVPNSMTTYEVATDEKRNITNSIYQWWPDGKLFFIDTDIVAISETGTTTLFSTIFATDWTSLFDDNSYGHVEIEGGSARFSNYQCALTKNSIANYNEGDHIRITLGNYNEAGDQTAILNVTFGGQVYQVTGTGNPDVVIDIPASGTPGPFILAGTDSGIYLFIGSVKIENLTPASTMKLTGTAFSYNGIDSPEYNVVNTFDGVTANNLSNCFASIENPAEVYIGLDLGSAKTVKTVKIYPRDNENGNTLLTDRLLNTKIQGSNTSTNADFVDLYTITSVTQGQFNTYSLATDFTAYRYYRLYKNDGTNLDVAEIEFYGPMGAASTKLTGIAFGTPNYLGSAAATTFDKMFDGDLTTFFDAADGSNGYAGLDLGTAKIVNKIKVAPRATLENRSQGITLQGSNTSSSDGYTNLFTIPDVLTANVLTEYPVNNTTAYRYYRMYSSQDGYCNLSEAEFYTSSALANNPDPASALQVVKLNLTASPNHTNLPDWNNYDYGMMPEFLNNPQGTTTGIKFLVDNGPVITENLGFEPPATTNFPGSVSSTLWELEYGGVLTWRFTGLDDTKAYTIKTYSYDNYDDGETSITWGGVTQNTLSYNNVTELTFSNITPMLGEISGRFDGTGIYLIVNGIILSED